MIKFKKKEASEKEASVMGQAQCADQAQDGVQVEGNASAKGYKWKKRLHRGLTEFLRGLVVVCRWFITGTIAYTIYLVHITTTLPVVGGLLANSVHTWELESWTELLAVWGIPYVFFAAVAFYYSVKFVRFISCWIGRFSSDLTDDILAKHKERFPS